MSALNLFKYAWDVWRQVWSFIGGHLNLQVKMFCLLNSFDYELMMETKKSLGLISFYFWNTNFGLDSPRKISGNKKMATSSTLQNIRVDY